MELVVKKFDELTPKEIWEIYRLRVQVFVIEQECIYQDVDEFDPVSYHVYLRDEDGIVAYLRVLPKGTTMDEVALGRVISVKRRQGYGSQVVRAGIKVAAEKFNADVIEIEAQIYVRSMYDKLGFVQTSEEFLDVGIPHIKMKLNLS